jgi:5-methylcytosine-specific restriction endonuclease McrA
MPKAYELPEPGQPFDPKLFKLGKPCKRNHIHADGMTLRYSKSTACVLCQRIDSYETQQRLRQNPEYRRRANAARAEKRKREGRPSRSKYGLPYTTKAVIQMHAAIRRAGKLPSVAALVQQQQFQHWAANPDDRRTIMAPWNAQQAQWLYLTDHSYRLYHRQKSKHNKAEKRGNHSTLIPGAQLLNRWTEFGYACAYCGKPDHRADELELEHVIPISRGGDHYLSNIVPACHQCNSSKRSCNAFTWYQQQSFYSDERWRKICAILNKDEPKWQQMRLIA